MKLKATVFGALLAGLPSPAFAVLAVNVDRTSVVPTSRDQTVFIDAFVTDIDNASERLNAFTVSFEGVGFSETGIRFLPPVGATSAAHPFVFRDFPGTIVEDLGSAATRLRVGVQVVPPTGEVDVTDLYNGLFSIPVFIPANFDPPTRLFPIVVDLSGTHFTGAGGAVISTAGTPGFVFGIPVPEPSAAALLMLPAVALLRRQWGRSPAVFG